MKFVDERWWQGAFKTDTSLGDFPVEFLAQEGSAEHEYPAQANAAGTAEVRAVGTLVGATHFAYAEHKQVVVLPDCLLVVFWGVVLVDFGLKIPRWIGNWVPPLNQEVHAGPLIG